MKTKHGIAVLVAVMMAFLMISSSVAEAYPRISDEAGLLQLSGMDDVYQIMKAVCEYCTPVFRTTDQPGSDEAAEKYLESIIGQADGVIFEINTAARRLTIYAQGRTGQIITPDVAAQITDNAYQYAKSGEFERCGISVFSEIYRELSQAGPGSDQPEDAPDGAARISYTDIMMNECTEARTLLRNVSRSGGSGDIPLLSEIRSHVYAVDLLNRMAQADGACVFECGETEVVLGTVDEILAEMMGGDREYTWELLTRLSTELDMLVSMLEDAMQ